MQGSESLGHFVRESFANRNTRNNKFSVRAFARQLGIQPATISEIMRGKRSVSRTYAATLLERLRCPAEEQEKILSDFSSNRRSAGSKEGVRYDSLEMDTYQLISEWYHFAILSLVKTQGFRNEPKYISKRLGITKRQARLAVNRLIRLGLLQYNKLGKLTRANKNLTTSDGIKNASLQRSHLENLELAQQSLFRDSIEIRDFSAVTFATDPSGLKEVRTLLRKLRDKTVAQLEKAPPTEVYKLCIQLFPITKKESK